MTTPDLYYLIPLIIIAATPVIIMLAIAVRRRHNVVAFLSLAAYALAFVSTINLSYLAPWEISTLLIMDKYALFYMGLLFAAGFAVTVLSYSYLQGREAGRAAD